MKIKILSSAMKTYWYSDRIGDELYVDYNIESVGNPFIYTKNHHYIRSCDSVITELPKSFSVKRCDDNKKWYKYLEWLVKQKNYSISMFVRVFVGVLDGVIGEKLHYDDLYPFGTEIHIDDMIKHIDYMERHIKGDILITELPESFCVKRCDDRDKWKKYIKWLNKTYNKEYYDNVGTYYGCDMGSCWSLASPIGTEIHIDDMIKHIDYMESQQHINGGEQFSKVSQLIAKMGKIIKEKEFDLTTNERRLAYARKYYPIGTRYKALNCIGDNFGESKSEYEPKLWEDRGRKGIETSLHGLVYSETTNQWAEIIKEEENMETQKLSRQGLKEIHSVACSTWKITLEGWGSRNPLEDYIELSQKEIDMMFNASDDNQKSILSKYLKQNDGSVDLSKIACEVYLDSQLAMIEIRNRFEYCDKAFWLNDVYFNWEIKKDSNDNLCLIPTKKK